MEGGGSGIACPGFPCTYFGWEFLSRMAQTVTGCGRPLSASVPNRAKPDILVRFSLGIRILLRNSRRKRSTENPGQAIPLPPPSKDLPPVLGKKEGWDTSLLFYAHARIWKFAVSRHAGGAASRGEKPSLTRLHTGSPRKMPAKLAGVWRASRKDAFPTRLSSKRQVCTGQRRQAGEEVLFLSSAGYQKK